MVEGEVWVLVDTRLRHLSLSSRRPLALPAVETGSHQGCEGDAGSTERFFSWFEVIVGGSCWW